MSDWNWSISSDTQWRFSPGANSFQYDWRDNDPNRCIDCGACSHICEYESILDNEGKACKFIPKEQWKKPVVDTTVCDGCGICEEDCPAYCIDIIPNEKNPIHNVSFLARPDDCHGCGVCERHCPIDAISMK